ncbi:MAG: hypothetical protein JWN72_1693 [Thermoleophilia bacterium]|nr:hypothetical protein [Thermoleophilia bacterium]
MTTDRTEAFAARIRVHVDVEELDSLHRDELWERVDRATRHEAVRTARWAPRPVRTMLVAAAAMLALSGIAIAQTDAVSRIFGADEPVANKVDQLRDPDGERATATEYRSLVESTLAPDEQGRPTVPTIDLAGADQSRVLVDEPTLGRAIAAPTIDGSDWCYLISFPVIDGYQPVGGGCGGNIGPSGVNVMVQNGDLDREGARIASVTAPAPVVPSPDGPSVDPHPTAGASAPGAPAPDLPAIPLMSVHREGGPADNRVYGIASDDVTRIEVEFADGTRAPVRLVDNVFIWTSGSRIPVTLHSWRGARENVQSVALD